MTLLELQEQLKFINNKHVSLNFHIVFKDNSIKFVDMGNSIENDFLEQFKNYINSRFGDNSELVFSNLSESTNQKNSAYYYDLPEKPESLKQLSQVMEIQPKEKFNFDVDIDNIEAFIIVISDVDNQIALYKKYYPIFTLKANPSKIRLIQKNDRFEKFEKNILTINESFEFLQTNDSLIVLSIKVLENFFGFEEIIKKTTEDNIKMIQSLEILEDVSQLREYALDIKNAKKIIKLKPHSPVLSLKSNVIFKFIQKHPLLSKSLKFNSDNTKLDLQTKISKERFIKLLNDDYLTSELTALQYDSQNKENIDSQIDSEV